MLLEDRKNIAQKIKHNFSELIVKDLVTYYDILALATSQSNLHLLDMDYVNAFQ